MTGAAANVVEALLADAAVVVPGEEEDVAEGGGWADWYIGGMTVYMGGGGEMIS